MRKTLAASAVVLSLSALTPPARAQVEPGPFAIRLEPVASGLTAPVQLKHTPIPGDNRLFIVEQSGLVKILLDGAVLPTPFLDIRSVMVTVNPGYDERGLLGLAFAPDYATSGRFFVHYSSPRVGVAGDPCLGTGRGCSNEVLAEFRVSGTNPNVADLASRVVLLTVPKPQFNHAGGFIDFGPDGYLYYSLGDGGGANDGLADNPPSHGPTGNAQNLASPLGKMHRFDVGAPGVLAFPADNPFLNTPGAYGGIYSYGHRNPYSAAFDDGPGGTGRLFVGDVGQDAFEEVDILQIGGNYGWPIREGYHCFDPFHTTTPPATCQGGFMEPIVEYGRTVGIATVAGGVYRGSAIPVLQGQYVFGDFSTAFTSANGHLFYLNPAEPSPATMHALRIGSNNRPLNLFVKGFGRDRNSELYVLASTNLGPAGTTGVILRIAPCAADFNQDGLVDPDDLSDIISCYFATPSCPRADVNGDGVADPDDLSDFISTFFAGC